MKVNIARNMSSPWKVHFLRHIISVVFQKPLPSHSNTPQTLLWALHVCQRFTVQQETLLCAWREAEDVNTKGFIFWCFEACQVSSYIKENADVSTAEMDRYHHRSEGFWVNFPFSRPILRYYHLKCKQLILLKTDDCVWENWCMYHLFMCLQLFATLENTTKLYLKQ